MARIDVRGVIIPNDYKWYYDWFEEDSTCPRDVQKIIDAYPNEPHDVYINSPGGAIDVGSEIYTMLRGHTAGVKIYITGQACSAASMIAASGYCEMSPTALLMVHCVSSGAHGNHSDMEHMAEVLRTADRALCTAYMNKTGMTEQEALDMMEHETWLNAQQALERKLIDKIMFEQQEPELMIASMFALPSKEQMERARTLAMAPEMERAMMNLKLLELEGATKWEEKNI